MKIRKIKLLCAKLACCLTLAFAAADAHAATVEIKIQNFAFNPSTATINVGDTVTWTQLDAGMQHTATSGVDAAPDGKFDSGFLSQNQTYSHTFTEAGNYPYFCIPHSSFMTGTIIVQQATAQAPVVSITSPTNNTVLTAPGQVTISADATVEGSTITMVEFFDGGTFLDMAHQSPFSVTVNLATGTHTLTAKATAANNQTTTSSAVTVTVSSGGTKIDDPLPSIAKSDLTVDLQLILDGMVSPVGMAVPDDGSGRMFVIDQAGLVYVLQNGAKLETPLLDVQSRLVALRAGYDERGLLGMAVHPNFAEHPFIYTYTSEPTAGDADFPITPDVGATNNHQSVITEWKIDSANTNRIDLSSRREILRIDEPQSNHNAGTMHFGPDGFLYVTLGDGGNADDEGSGHLPGQGNAQNINRILGKMIRIDVDGRTSPNGQYGIPNDNPFVGVDGLDEIFAYGFRNPYTWSFDRMTGEIYVADVGQNFVEELDRVFKGGNYGWHIKEGSFYFDPNGTNAGFVTTVPVTDVPGNLIDPIAEYDHQDGLAIIGGYVYYGTKIPALYGRYITADLGTFAAPAGRLFYLNGDTFKELRLGLDDHPLNLWVKGFGQDQEGEVYLFASGKLGPSGTDGKMFKIVPVSDTITVSNVMRMDTNVMVNWGGGVGPYLIESKSSIGEPAWRRVSTSATNLAMFGASGEAGFYRIVDMAGNRATPFTVYMTSAAERPTPVNNPAGLGTGTLVLEGNTLTFDIHYSGLTGPAILAHIHSPATAAESAGVAINLQPFNGGSFSTEGALSGSVQLTPQQKADILAGKAYVNVHTDQNKSGEIRGQIVPVLFSANLSGDAERPEVATEGNGTGTFMLVGNQLTFNIAYANLSGVATLSHIHGPATLETSAGVMINLAPFNGGAFDTNGTLSGTVTLDDNEIAALVDGLAYVNVHTGNNPTGEIRGQILPRVSAIPFSAALSGLAERPTPLTNSATGSATLALEGNTLEFNITYSGLSGPATLAHFHGPAISSEVASVLINLAPYNNGGFNTSGALAGKVALTEQQRAYLLQGKLYVNIHTAANPSGEIRGQVSPVLFQAQLSGAAERPEGIENAGQGHASFLLVGNQLTVNATYADLTSEAIAAHIHGTSTTAGSAPIMINLAPVNDSGFGTSGSFAGTVTAQPDQIGAIIDELTYMNIHTTTNGGGEIRGQLTH